MLHYSAMPASSGRLTIRELGHVSLFVGDLDATRRFYRDILGLAETGTGKGGRIVFFSAGVHHHDLSCELARAEGRRSRTRAAGWRRTASRRSARRPPRSACAIPTATRSSCTSLPPGSEAAGAEPGRTTPRGADRGRRARSTGHRPASGPVSSRRIASAVSIARERLEISNGLVT